MTSATFAVVVDFDIFPERVEEFEEAMLLQASNSLQLEEGCRQFDVFRDPQAEATFVLFELYDDEGAFETHLATDHFEAFSTKVESMVKNRIIRRLHRV